MVILFNAGAGAQEKTAKNKQDSTQVKAGLPLKDQKDTVKVLKQVDITFKKQAIQRKGDRLIFNVEGNAAVAGNPLLEIMRQVPGLSVTNDKVNIRGKEGLIIMIDNRRTYMTGDELLSYLKNTPAETISQLELITNPSARYDAEGNAGIINIKTKKGGLTGTTGSVSQTLGYGRFFKSTSAGQIVYTSPRLSLYGNSYLGYNKGFENYYSETNAGNHDKVFNNNYTENTSKNSYSYQAGFDYSADSQHRIGGLIDGSIRPDAQSDGFSQIQKTGTDQQYVVTNDRSKTNNKNTAVNLHYNWNNTRNTDLFNADANYVKYNYVSGSGQFSNYYDSPSYQLITADQQLRNQSLRTVTVRTGKADYTHKWANQQTLESGFKWSRVQTNSDLRYEELIGSAWTNDSGKTNQYLFTEQIYAAYVNYNAQFGSLNIQSGLRAEKTISNGYSKTIDSETKRNYFKLFPSLFISQTFLKDHSWSLSYSYRIDRPTYSYLNPFTFINNPYSYFRGNPNLKPQYTHNFEGNYDFQKRFFLTLGYSHTTDMITEIAERGSQIDITGGTRTNLNSMDSYNLSLSIPLQPLKGWDINIYAGGFRNVINDHTGFTNGKTTFTTTISSSAALPAGFTADFNGDYQTTMSYGTIILRPMYAVNGGLKKAFFAGKLNLRANVSDIFNQRKMIFASTYAGIERSGLNTSESRVFRLTASYKFGKVKAKQERQTGAEEERKRAGN